MRWHLKEKRNGCNCQRRNHNHQRVRSLEIYGVLTKEKMTGMGMQFLFAGTEKNDPTKLHTVIKFESFEAMQAFGADKELTETRRQAGAVIESGVMTPISDDFFTNYPDAFMALDFESK